VSFDFLRLLSFQDLVDCLVEDLAISVDIHASGVRLTVTCSFNAGLPPVNCPSAMQKRSEIALNPSIQPMIAPGATAAPASASKPWSTISPSMRTANLVNPTRHRPPSCRAIQQCDGL